jgi:hypothetical protein
MRADERILAAISGARSAAQFDQNVIPVLRENSSLIFQTIVYSKAWRNMERYGYSMEGTSASMYLAGSTGSLQVADNAIRYYERIRQDPDSR